MPNKIPSVGSTICSAVKNALPLLRTKVHMVGSVLFMLLLLGSVSYGAIFSFGKSASAAPNSTINYQARILLASGALVPDGNYHIEFKIYNASAADGGETPDQGACTVNSGTADEDCLWVETRTTGNLVRVVNGYVAVNLGSVTAFPSNMPWGDQLYVTMRVGGTSGPTWDTEMVNPTTGRMRITAVPYAFSSANVSTANTNTASTNSNSISIQTGNASGATSNSGAITIDTGTATGTAGAIALGTSNASALTIGRTGVTTTIQGSVALTGSGTALAVTNNVQVDGNTTLGSNSSDTLTVNANSTFNGNLTVTNGDTFTNAGASLFTAVAISDISGGGDIGTAAGTVDAATTFNINQTTASQTLTLPTPTVTTAGRIVYVNNVGSTSFTMYGSVIATGRSNAFIWNGSAWVTTVSLSGSVVNTVGTIDSQTKSADGAVISSNAIYLQTADVSNVGLVSIGNQTFNGVKTFDDGLVVTSGGATITAGDLAVNSDMITSDGFLTINSTSYVRIGDSGTPGVANGDDDLYVEGDLEADGVLNVAGRATFSEDIVSSTTGIVRTLDRTVAGDSVGFTLRSGATVSGNTGDFTLRSGNATGGNSGSVLIDSGTSSGGTTGTISIGTANASGITIGRTGVTTTNAGSLSVTQDASITGNLTVDTSTFFVNSSNDFVSVGSTSDLGGRFQVVGANDETQLLVRANGTQSMSNPLVLLQNSSGSELARINATASSLFFGNAAGGSSAAGVNNTGIGASALGSVSTGTGNTTLGSGALASVSVNNNNTAVGYNAGNLTTGSNNIFLGALAGDNVTTGSDNIIIGYNLDASAAGVNNELRIGGVLQGNTSTLAAQFNGALTVTGLTTLNGGLTIETGDTFTINGDALTDLTGSGLVVSGGALTVDTAAGTGFIQNQNASDQTGNFRISGTGRANTSFTAPLFDVSAAGTLSLGTSTATAITIGQAGVTTTNAGALTVSQLLTGSLGATISGATINLNASSNFNTNINTGTSTGNVAIGNSAAGTISLQSASTIGITGTTTITGLGSTTDALVVNNSTSTGDILNLQDNGTDVLTVLDDGYVNIQPVANSTTAFVIRNASGTGIFSVNTTDGQIGTIATTGAATNSQPIRLRTGNASGSGSNSGAIIIRSGNTNDGTVGNIEIDTGSPTSGTNYGSIFIGSNYRNGGINIGTVGTDARVSTVNISNTSGNSTQTVNIGSNGNANNVVTILGGSSAGVNLQTTGAGTVAIGNSSSTTTVLGTTTINTTGTATTSIGNSGAVTTLTGSSILLNSATLQRTAAGTTSLDLVDGSNTTLALTNSGAGVANLTVDGTIAVATLGSADTSTYLCRNSSNIIAGCVVAPLTSSLTDNITDAFDLQEGTNNYININTTNSSENISFGNGTTNPTFTFQGSGLTTFTGDIAVNGDDITSDSNLTVNATGYVRIGDSGTPGVANGDDDLYIEGDVETDGLLAVQGTAANGLQSSIATIGGTVASTGADQMSALLINSSYTVSTSSDIDLFGGLFAPTTSTGNLNTGTANIIGLGAVPSYTGSGTLSGIIGLVVQNQNLGSGTIGSSSGIQVAQPNNLATITNNVGIGIQDHTAGTNNTNLLITVSTNPPTGQWSIYNESTKDNAFAGSLRVGGTAAPTVALDVTGSGAFTGDLAVNGDDITADGALTVNSASYVRIGDTGTPGVANGDDDLYVEGDLEVDGGITLGTDTVTDITGAGLTVSGGALTLDITSASGAFINGGNNFASASSIGNTSNVDLNVETNNLTRLTVQADGDVAFDTDVLFVDAANNRVGINNASPGTALDVVGAGQFSGTITANSAFYLGQVIQGTVASTSLTGFNNQVALDPDDASSVSNVYGFQNLPILQNSAKSTNFVAGYFQVRTAASYTGDVNTAKGIEVAAPSISSTDKFDNYYGIQISNPSGNGGNTTGTITNNGLRVESFTAAAGVGGTVNNQGIRVAVPDGDGTNGTVNNRGIYITGNASLGDTNYAIYSDSTTQSYLAGNLGLGDTSPAALLTVGNGDLLQINSSGDITTANAENLSITTGTTGTLTVDTGTTGAIGIGTGSNAKTITIGNGTGATSLVLNAGTGNIDIGANAFARTTNIATGAAAQTVTVGSTNGSSSLTLQSGTGNLNITTQGTGSLNVGNNAVAQTINVGNTTGATALNLRVGTGNFSLDGVAGSTYALGASTTTGTITIGGTAQTGNITLGSSSGTNSVLIGNGSGATTVNIANVTTGGAVNIGAAMTTGTITIGGTGAQTGTIALGTGTGAQTINLGTGGTGAKTVTVGSTASTGTSTLQSGSGGVIFNVSGTQQAIFAGSNTLYLGNASTSGTAAAPNAFTVQGTGNSTAAGTGGSLSVIGGAGNTTGAGGGVTVRAGTGGATGVGGNLTLQGGTGGATSGNGGDVLIVGGTSTSGTKGLVVIDTATYQTAATQNSADSVTGSTTAISSANINTSGAIRLNATGTSQIFTMGDPTNTTAGRVIYVTNIGSNDFTLSVNGGGSGNTIALKPNTTATMYWNGADWTAAGASSATDLQAAYNNTATSAGAAEIILNNSATSDGLTVRNNASNPIIGAIFEAQTSVGSNLFSINNNAVEYASNGGSETAGGTSTTFPSNTWSQSPTGGTQATVARTITAGQFATGVAAASVVTTGATTANQGIANQISTPVSGVATNTALANNLVYTVSFSVKGTTNFSTLDVVYSRDGTNTSTTSCATARTVTQSVWTRINCDFTVPSSGVTTSNAIFIRQSDSNTTARTFYIDNLSVTINANTNHAADGSVNTALGTNWQAIGGSVASTSSVIYDTSGAVDVTTGVANRGVFNNLSNNIAPTSSAAGVQYRVSFYARGDGTTAPTFNVAYSPDNGGSTIACQDYVNQTLDTNNTYELVSCLFTTNSTAVTTAQLRITQSGATPARFYIDALTVTLNNNNSNNVQIGGANEGGPVTLFTLDRSAGAPIAANNDTYLGSMYYDTVTGRIQCYEADGWGACGGAPDNIVNLNPEYAGSVLNGSGVGTMTADFCSNDASLSVNSSLCSSGQAKNYYRWTSPQATEQTYSIYITYQLPSTFNDFASDDTVQLVARTDSTTNAAVTYEMFRSTTSPSNDVEQCGSGETTVVTSANTWQTVGINGNEATSCTFNASDFIIFKINLKAKSNANAYVSTLSFTTTGK